MFCFPAFIEMYTFPAISIPAIVCLCFLLSCVWFFLRLERLRSNVHVTCMCHARNMYTAMCIHDSMRTRAVRPKRAAPPLPQPPPSPRSAPLPPRNTSSSPPHTTSVFDSRRLSFIVLSYLRAVRVCIVST